jgi:hypothetical protein
MQVRSLAQAKLFPENQKCHIESTLLMGSISMCNLYKKSCRHCSENRLETSKILEIF